MTPLHSKFHECLWVEKNQFIANLFCVRHLRTFCQFRVFLMPPPLSSFNNIVVVYIVHFVQNKNKKKTIFYSVKLQIFIPFYLNFLLFLYFLSCRRSSVRMPKQLQLQTRLKICTTSVVQSQPRVFNFFFCSTCCKEKHFIYAYSSLIFLLVFLFF